MNLLVVLFGLLIPTAAWAVVPQVPRVPPGGNTVRVSGRVVGADGAPVAGAVVATEAEPTLTSTSVLTDAEGKYTIVVRVRQGELNLVVMAKGFGREAVPGSRSPETRR